MNTFDITVYLDIARRRIYWIIIPFMAAILAGLGYILLVPKIYQAETLILVQPQKVPEDFVRSIVESEIDDRSAILNAGKGRLKRLFKKRNQ